MKQNDKMIKQIADNEFLTIKKFAELAGVSVQSVYKGLNNRLNPWVELVDNQKMLRYQALKEIYGVEVEQPIQPKLNNLFNHNSDIITVLQKTIDTLQGQLETKDKLIDKMEAELSEERQHSRTQADKIAILADQAQKLQLAQISSSEQQLVTDGSAANGDKPNRWERFKQIFKGK